MEHGAETIPASAESVLASERTSEPATSLRGEAPCLAVCANASDCSIAATGATVEWYRGAGEYCPECGGSLSPRDRTPLLAEPSTALSQLPPGAPLAAVAGHPARLGTRTASVSRRGSWIIAAAVAATAALGFAAWGFAFNRPTEDVIRVCPIAIAAQLAADLVRGYSAKNATSAGRFDLTQGSVCEVRFSLAPQRPEAAIASDALVTIVNPRNPLARVSTMQLRAIFTGSIRDWSQLGEPRGRIVPILPGADSEEAKALAASLFAGVRIDRDVLRGSTSADVMRIVSGADSTGRNAIGLVAFRHLDTAKMVPITGAPPPDATSIAAGRYPYMLTIGITLGAGPNALASALIDYARSTDGAAIVIKDGLIPPSTR
jgi:hypothetical protein